MGPYADFPGALVGFVWPYADFPGVPGAFLSPGSVSQARANTLDNLTPRGAQHQTPARCVSPEGTKRAAGNGALALDFGFLSPRGSRPTLLWLSTLEAQRGCAVPACLLPWAGKDPFPQKVHTPSCGPLLSQSGLCSPNLVRDRPMGMFIVCDLTEANVDQKKCWHFGVPFPRFKKDQPLQPC